MRYIKGFRQRTVVCFALGVISSLAAINTIRNIPSDMDRAGIPSYIIGAIAIPGVLFLVALNLGLEDKKRKKS